MKEQRSFINRYKFILLFIILVVTLTLIVSLLFRQKPSQERREDTIITTPTPTAGPSQLAPQEQAYPEGIPQQFPQGNIPQKGVVVVTSNVDNIRVMIDAGEEEVPDQEFIIPINQTPFKISSIPVGNHTLIASKPGYNFVSVNFTIKEGEITRLHVQLEPLPNGMINKAEKQERNV